jgi:hypothetical protein
MSNVPLENQIRAIETLITVASRGEKLKPSEYKFIQPKLDAALESLYWLKRNERAIKLSVSKLGVSE